MNGEEGVPEGATIEDVLYIVDGGALVIWSLP